MDKKSWAPLCVWITSREHFQDTSLISSCEMIGNFVRIRRNHFHDFFPRIRTNSYEISMVRTDGKKSPCRASVCSWGLLVMRFGVAESQMRQNSHFIIYSCLWKHCLFTILVIMLLIHKKIAWRSSSITTTLITGRLTRCMSRWRRSSSSGTTTCCNCQVLVYHFMYDIIS